MVNKLNGRVLAILAVSSLALPLVSGCAAKSVVVAVEVPVAAPPPPAPVVTPAPAPAETIVLPGELEFENNSPYIKRTQETLDLLSQLASILQKNTHITKLRIEGHTDNIGTAKHNQVLSQERADTVAHWLMAHDVDPSRLSTVGLGDTHPLVDNATRDHRRMNRRTEFHVQELDGSPIPDESSDAPAASGEVAQTDD